MCGPVVTDPRPEVLAHIADAVLGLALGLRMLGATEAGPKAVVLGEVDKAGMEDRVAMVVVTQPDRLDSVVENLLWHTAEVVEGLLMASEEERQRLAVGEVEVLRSRPAQCHDESLHALATRLLERAPVDLRLVSGWSFEAHRRLLLGQGAEGMHELFENAASTAVTHLSDFVIENFGVAHRILADHAPEQVLAKGVELGARLSMFRCDEAPTWSMRRMVLRSRPVRRAISLIDLPLTQASWTSMNSLWPTISIPP